MMSFHVYATHDSPSREFHLFFFLLYCDAGWIAVFTFTGRVVEIFPTSPVPNFACSHHLRVWLTRDVLDRNIVGLTLLVFVARILDSELFRAACLLADWFIRTIVTWFRLPNHRQKAQLVRNDDFIASLPLCEGSLLRNFGEVRFGAINVDWPAVNSWLRSGASARGGLGSENVRSCDIHSSLVGRKDSRTFCWLIAASTSISDLLRLGYVNPRRFIYDFRLSLAALLSCPLERV